MKASTRILAVLGMGLMTGSSFGASPAQAAAPAGQGLAKPSVSQAQQPWDDDDVIGYYRTLRACERVGRIGEWADRWEDYDCERVRRGFHRGMWKLEVERGWG